MANVSRRGAMGVGAALGGVGGFLMPGTDEEGNTKSRMMSAASGAATGGALGLGVGHLAKGHTTRALKGQFDRNAIPGTTNPKIEQTPATGAAIQDPLKNRSGPGKFNPDTGALLAPNI
jgi:hypothetical protein